MFHISVFKDWYTLSHPQYTTNQSPPLTSTMQQIEYQSTVHQNVYLLKQPSNPKLEYLLQHINSNNLSFPQPDSCLVVPVFQKGDDPIDAINHMMSFLTALSHPGETNFLALGTIRKYTLVQSGLATRETTDLIYPGLPDIQSLRPVITHNAAYQAADLDAYDSRLKI
ncbi:hypothetical protein Tco_0252304 [Tanacetum coccineum]